MSSEPDYPAVNDARRFEAALRRFDEENSRDPNAEFVDGIAHPRELLYAERLTNWVLKLCPDASEELRLAARCQHICRWTIRRDSYPLSRAGYLKWREDLKRFHGDKAAQVLREVGYPEPMVLKVRALNLKKDFPNDPDSRVLEDALCLVFLEYQLTYLAAKTADEKMINALRKSWNKMTPAARDWALKLHYEPKEKSLIDRALAPDS